MRTIKKISLALFIISISNLSFADGETKTRSTCNGTGWKWKARSRVTKLGFPTTDKETKCYKIGNYPDTYASNTCAYQSATNNWGAESQYGAVTRWYWMCARGYNSFPLYYNLVQDKLKDAPIGYENSRVTCKATTFNQDKVIKEGIDASLTVLGKDLFSSVEIIMWLPSKEDDSIPTKEKTFWRGKIELLNGQVNLTGDFPKNSFTLKERVTSEGVEYNLIISNLTIEANYPDGVTNTDLIEVAMITDAGINEKIAIKNILKQSEEENIFDVVVYPNPTKDLINIKFNSDDIDEHVNIKLYKSNGQIVTNFKEHNIKRGGVIIFDLKSLGLNNGVYYLLISNGKKSQLKKIVLNN
jgi:hypothetical protein